MAHEIVLRIRQGGVLLPERIDGGMAIMSLLQMWIEQRRDLCIVQDPWYKWEGYGPLIRLEK